ncbi:MAG: leucine-rich repeat protein [Muribaculaceae bacterium]|nr:leucine-rich repeat protein [Muribaculaceae bacterium]
MKKLLLFFLLIFISLQGRAYEFIVDDYAYSIQDFNERTVFVTYRYGATYPSIVNIPATIVYEEHEFTVVGIGSSAFEAKNNINKVILPNTIKYIGSYAFKSCKNLTSVSLNTGLETIERQAFELCERLETLIIPGSVTHMDGCLKDCKNLKVLIFDDGDKDIYISGQSLATTALETLYLGRNISNSSKNNPFPGTSKLKTFYFGPSVTKASELSIQSSVLEEIYSFSMTPPKVKSFLNSQYMKTIVNIPFGSLYSYQNDSKWGSFWHLQETLEVLGEPELEALFVNPEIISCFKGDSFKIEVYPFPEEASLPELVWVSDDPQIIMVDKNGNCNAIANGQTIIRVQTLELDKVLSAECQITVCAKEPELEAISISESSLEVHPGQEISLRVITSPEDAKMPELNWISSNPTVATVSKNGHVSVLTPGETTITVETVGLSENLTASCEIKSTEIESPIPEETIYLVGSPTGWSIETSNMPLSKIADGIYSGTYYINAGDLFFRFYTQLGNWDVGSIAAQYVDIAVPTELTDGIYMGNCVDGKGSWMIENWEGGYLTMTVDLNNMKVGYYKNLEASLPECLYIPGNLNGWTLGEYSKLLPQGGEKGIYKGVFDVSNGSMGEFVITTLPDWSGAQFGGLCFSLLSGQTYTALMLSKKYFDKNADCVSFEGIKLEVTVNWLTQVVAFKSIDDENEESSDYLDMIVYEGDNEMNTREFILVPNSDIRGIYEGCFDIEPTSYNALEFNIATPLVWNENRNQFIHEEYYGGPTFRLYSNIPVTFQMHPDGKFRIESWEGGILNVTVDWNTKEISFSSPSQPEGYDFMVDNLYYSIIENNNVSVSAYIWDETLRNYDLVIPEIVEYNGNVYNIIEIGSSSFTYSPFKTVKIPDSVIKIEPFSFTGSQELERVELGNSVEEIGGFANCESLSSINLPESLKIIREGCFSFCFALSEIELPQSLEIMENGVFYNCSSLKNIEIPNTITELGEITFFACWELEKVVLPAYLTKIGSGTFNSDYNLKSIICDAIEPPVCTGECFDMVPTETCELIVPAQSYEKYATTYPWSEFLNINAAIESINADPSTLKIYNLMGVPQNSENLSPGIYIVNGKKVVVRRNGDMEF